MQDSPSLETPSMWPCQQGSQEDLASEGEPIMCVPTEE